MILLYTLIAVIIALIASIVYLLIKYPPKKDDDNGENIPDVKSNDCTVPQLLMNNITCPGVSTIPVSNPVCKVTASEDDCRIQDGCVYYSQINASRTGCLSNHKKPIMSDDMCKNIEQKLCDGTTKGCHFVDAPIKGVCISDATLPDMTNKKCSTYASGACGKAKGCKWNDLKTKSLCLDLIERADCMFPSICGSSIDYCNQKGGVKCNGNPHGYFGDNSNGNASAIDDKRIFGCTTAQTVLGFKPVCTTTPTEMPKCNFHEPKSECDLSDGCAYFDDTQIVDGGMCVFNGTGIPRKGVTCNTNATEADCVKNAELCAWKTEPGCVPVVSPSKCIDKSDGLAYCGIASKYCKAECNENPQ